MDVTKSQKIHWEADGKACVETTEVVEHNINHYYQVKLTEHGIDLWRTERWSRISEFDLQYNRDQAVEEFDREFAAEMETHSVGDGWYEFQVHALLGLFGKHFREGMALNSPTPFETTYRVVQKSMGIVETAST